MIHEKDIARLRGDLPVSNPRAVESAVTVTACILIVAVLVAAALFVRMISGMIGVN